MGRDELDIFNDDNLVSVNEGLGVYCRRFFVKVKSKY